ncbi:MAG TPA: DUF58 domain-containing protein [Methylocystis sp.]|nr:DUF58 domain-containing protein [Methylocystis sp.]
MAQVETHWFDPLKAPIHSLEDPAAELASRLPRLAAKAREVAGSLVHGVHGRRRAGAGETFWQYRPFAPGEAAQRIDWRRSARGDQLYVREREWEAAQNFFVWIDVSPSMAFKSSLAADYKIDRAVVLGLALADALVRCGERVGALGASPALCARNIIERLAEILAAQAPSSRALDIPSATALPQRAKLALISDFLCDADALAARLRDYAAAGAHGALLMVIDPAEETFPFAGETLFRDPDAGAPFLAGDAGALREAYAQRLDEHRAALRLAAQSAGFLFLQHHTDRPATEAALTLLTGLEEASWG